MQLAWIMLGLECWKEAEELLVQVMEIISKLLGAEHPFTLLIYVWKQGPCNEAERLEVQVMKAGKRLSKGKNESARQRPPGISGHFLPLFKSVRN